MNSFSNDIDIETSGGFGRRILELPPPRELGPGMLRIWEYWNLKRGNRSAPRRRDIDPIDMARDLSGIILYDVEPDPVRFRYRLTGSDTDRIHGKALKGHYVDTLEPPEFATMLHDDFSAMLDEGKPQLARLDFQNVEGRMRHYEALRLPLIDADGQVVMIMVYANHGQQRT